MFNSKNLIALGVATFAFGTMLAQTPKKFCDAAEKFVKASSYEEAIDNYSKAIELDPQFDKAYIARAVCYEKVNKKDLAVEDYKKASAFEPKEKEHYYNAGRLLAELQRDKEADEQLRKALERDKDYTEALAAEVSVLFRLKDYNYGMTVTQMAIDNKKTAQNYYNHAVMLDSLKNLADAE